VSTTDCGRYDRARLLRPSWAEIDVGAVRANLARARRMVGPDTRIYFVCKGDGFGFGAAAMVRVADRAGADGFCVGSPDEVVSVRATGTTRPVLLFACTLPEDLPAAAELGCMVTVQSPADAAAVAGAGRPIEVFVEIDCGLGRFGLKEPQWDEVFARLRGTPMVTVRGIYGHLSSPDDPRTSRAQADLFARATTHAEAAGLSGLVRMLASSRVMLGYPEMNLDAVDPGRLIYGGGFDGHWLEKGGLRPVLRAVKARLIQIQSHPVGTVLGIGYGAPIPIERPMRIAVAPIGFWDGLNHVPPLGEVLVRGQRCAILGRRTFQHSVIDVTSLPDAVAGDEVVVMGRQGDQIITMDDLARGTGIPVIELVPRLASSLPHVHVDEGE
jgi:alanine racemase